jgi:transglutaminase-like putative cysteine protease
MAIRCCESDKSLRKFIVVFSLLCTVVLNSCVTGPNSVGLDLNYLIFGKADNIAWTHTQLKEAPQNVRLEKLSNASREASNLYRYAERVGVADNTWYQVFARGMSVYFVYKNVKGVTGKTFTTFTYEVYKSYSLAPTPETVTPDVPPQFPVITPEELERVELAYEETFNYIRRQGKNLRIYDMIERNDFIRKYQGIPNTNAVLDAKNKKIEIYDIHKTSQEDIVALAKKEPNNFLKVRMIHDWVADVFAYDYDLLWWMDNVSGRNAEFTLRAIVERQRGVCFEYAILFWFLLDAAGIDTYLITDFSQPNIGHAYNMVIIDDTGYIIDTTWDSGNKYKFGEILEFKKMVSKNYYMPDVSESYKLRGW